MARDFGLDKALDSFPALRTLAFAANRRLLLTVRTISSDPMRGDEAFQRLAQPKIVGQRRSID